MKLLAKAPEERYQTAAGLLADLERCRERLAGAGAIAHVRARPARRREPVRVRRAALRPRARGPRAARRIRPRGAAARSRPCWCRATRAIGKSSLVRELLAPVTRAARLLRVAASSTSSTATCRTARSCGARPAARAAARRERDDRRAGTTAIAAALGDDARSLARRATRRSSACSARSRAVPALDPAATRSAVSARACAASSRCSPGARHPLVVFLDDVQWADRASLQLLTRLAISDATESLPDHEAFRDNEVDARTRFAAARELGERRGARSPRIALAPLPLGETARADRRCAAAARPSEIADAAALIWRKTEGNPFFVRQFLPRAARRPATSRSTRASTPFGFDSPRSIARAITGERRRSARRQLRQAAGARPATCSSPPRRSATASTSTCSR